MTFDFGGTKYWIWFQYTKHDGKRQTMCYVDIERKNLITDPAGVRAIFAAGHSLCASCDQFRKETGRKVALTRALKHPAIFERFGQKNMKNFRAAAWSCYLNRAKESNGKIN